MLKAVPVMLLPVMETAAVPELERVTDAGALRLPTATLPKLTLLRLGERTPAPAPSEVADVDEVRPEQPERATLATIAMRIAGIAKAPSRGKRKRMTQTV